MESASEPPKKCAECGQPAQLKCSVCKSVAYCNKEHQKKNWKEHKKACRPYEIHQSAELGRFLIASRDLAPGDIIISESPLVFGPRTQRMLDGPVPCVGCCRLINVDNSDRCIGCGWPVCNTQCLGLKDMNRHLQECLFLAMRPGLAINQMHDYYRHDVLLTLRCLLLQRKGSKKWDQLLEMESHLDKRGKGTSIYKEVEERVVKYLRNNYIHPLKTLEVETKSRILEDVSEETLHRICGIIDVNALEISQNVDISALYPTAYLMEHSCISNTSHCFAGEDADFRITVRASAPIKKGEHISTTYTHVLWGTQARREHLREAKYFSCFCRRCKDPTELGSYMSALKCLGTEKEPCKGIHMPLDPCDDETDWVCNVCPLRVTNEQACCLINKIGEDVDEVQLMSPTVTTLENLLQKISTFLHPRHYHIYNLKHSLIQLYGYQQGHLHNQLNDDVLKRKIEWCKDLLEITKIVDPGNARLSLYLGVLYHEIYLAMMATLKRKSFQSKNIDIVKEAKEARTYLEIGKEVLKNELMTGAGAKLNDLIDEAFKESSSYITSKQKA